MRRASAPVKVVNINSAGELFTPGDYPICRSDNPQIFKFLEEIRKNGRSDSSIIRRGRS